MRLVVIGNGFDLHHDLKTKFSDYCIYLNENQPETIDSIQKFTFFEGNCCNIFNDADIFWADVENNLSFNYSRIFNALKDLVDSEFMDRDISSDDWNSKPKSIEDILNEMHEPFPANDIDDVDDVNTQFTSDALVDWVKSINIDKVEKDPKLSLSSEDYFVSFNYTRTLEDIYKIKWRNVLHIHGCFYNDFPCTLQFGNPLQTPASVRAIFERNLKDDFRLERVRPALEKIESFAREMSKDVESNIPILDNFLNGKEISEVVIMGHSYLKGDKQYYQKVLVPNYRTKKWTIYYHQGHEETDARDFLKENGIEGCTIHW